MVAVACMCPIKISKELIDFDIPDKFKCEICNFYSEDKKSILEHIKLHNHHL